MGVVLLFCSRWLGKNVIDELCGGGKQANPSHVPLVARDSMTRCWSLLMDDLLKVQGRILPLSS